MQKSEIEKLKKDIKRANQRLRQLEKFGFTNSSLAYRHIEKLNYDNDKAIGYTKKGEIKFKTNLKNLTYNEINHLQSVVEKFLNARTSTSTGILQMTEESRKQYEEKTGQTVEKNTYAEMWTNAKCVEFLNLYGSKEVERLTKVYGAESAVKTMEMVIDIYHNTGMQPSILVVDEIANNLKGYDENENPFL